MDAIQCCQAPTTYIVEGMTTSLKFGRAFATGCGGKTDNSTILRRTDVALFGDPRHWPLLQAAIEQGRNWYYGDHAYFRRRQYFRITKNAYQHDCVGEATPKRFERLNWTIKPWQTGKKILICPQHERFFALHGLNKQQWVNNTISELKKYTNRPIEVRDKRGGNNTEQEFDGALHNVHAVVVYTSVAGMQAALAGVPCFATHDCVSSKFGSMDLSKIESPIKPDNREQLAWVLADNQWTLSEIARGDAWEKLQ